MPSMPLELAYDLSSPGSLLIVLPQRATWSWAGGTFVDCGRWGSAGLGGGGGRGLLTAPFVVWSYEGGGWSGTRPFELLNLRAAIRSFTDIEPRSSAMAGVGIVPRYPGETSCSLGVGYCG